MKLTIALLVALIPCSFANASPSRQPTLPNECSTLIKVISAASMGGLSPDASGNQIVMKETQDLVLVKSVQRRVLNRGDEGIGYEAEYTVRTKISNYSETGTFIVDDIGGGNCILKRAVLN